MSPSVATRPLSEVIHIASCPEHGIAGQDETTCPVCEGACAQVAMVAVVDPERGPCACGCGHPRRASSDYASDACRTRHWKRETGYVHPAAESARNARNGSQGALQRRGRPGGAQVSYGVAVRALARYFIRARVIEDEALATRVAETVLSPALPPRQRKRARTRGAR
jgi:hypothetical protein